MAVRFILGVRAFTIFHFMLQLITILNRCHRFPGFVYRQARFSADGRSIEIAVSPRMRSKAICSGCHRRAPGYDRLAERRFEFVPFWGFLVFLLYAMRRVDCPRCQAVVVEEVPWGDGKRTLTRAYMLFLAAGLAGSPGRKRPRRFAPHGTKSSTLSNMSSPMDWDTVNSARSTPSESTRSSTPKGIST